MALQTGHRHLEWGLSKISGKVLVLVVASEKNSFGPQGLDVNEGQISAKIYSI